MTKESQNYEATIFDEIFGDKMRDFIGRKFINEDIYKVYMDMYMIITQKDMKHSLSEKEIIFKKKYNKYVYVVKKHHSDRFNRKKSYVSIVHNDEDIDSVLNTIKTNLQKE